MKIPKKLKIGTFTFSIEDSDKQLLDGTLGLCYFDACRIKLLTEGASVDDAGGVFTKEKREQIFLHEVCHAILHDMDNHKLCSNEVFINQLSKRLHQIIPQLEGK